MPKPTDPKYTQAETERSAPGFVTAPCPDCECPSNRVHSCYQRRLADTPDRFHLWQTSAPRWNNAYARTPDACSHPAPIRVTCRTLNCHAAKELSPIEARIRERHAIVHALLDQGHGIREIARELHMGGNTVRRSARAATPEELLGSRRQPRPSQLDPYKPYLDKRWVGPHQCRSPARRAQRAWLPRQLPDHQQLPAATGRRRIRVVGPAPPGLRQVTGWIMHHPDRLSESEAKRLAEVLTRCPELAAAHRLIRSFAEILSTRTGQHLKAWVVRARAEELPGVHSFAHAA